MLSLLKTYLQTRMLVIVIAGSLMTGIALTETALCMVAPPDPPAATAEEPAPPKEETTSDQLVSQVETPSTSTSTAAAPDNSATAEAPAFEAPASSEDLIAQFDF